MTTAEQMLDGNSAAELDHDLTTMRDDRLIAAYRSEAEADVEDRWWANLDLADACTALSVDELDEVKEGLREGLYLGTALQRICDEYLRSEEGCEAIAERALELAEENDA